MIPFLRPILPSAERYQQHINKMHENGWFSNNGEFVQQFERDLQEYLQTNREIVVVNNAAMGLILAIRALDIKGGVLIPSFTFAATAGAVSWCNLPYEYVDIDQYWCMDPHLVEAKLQSGQYGAIMPVHTLGLPCDVRYYEQLGNRYNVKVIFDAAAAVGASCNNRRIGNFGDIEVFSLHATKCLPIGEGGFLSIRDYEVAERVRQLKNFGFMHARSAELDGVNAKMPEVMAAIGVEALKDLKQHMRNRKRYVQVYQKSLSDLVEFQPIRSGCEHGYQILGCLVKKDVDTNVLVKRLAERKIQIRQYFNPPVHTQPAYAQDVILPKTIEIAKHVISLPLYSTMDDITIETVCQNLRDILEN